jgi:hypothetical protein
MRILALVAALACSGAATAAGAPTAALTGSWGGAGIGLSITEDGARVEYDCAHGSLDRRIEPDRTGRFVVVGSHVEEHGGPVREGESTSYPVRFAGRVKGNGMSLTVTRASNGEVIGTFSLAQGLEPSIVKCR